MKNKKKAIVYLTQSRITGQTFHWHDEQELLIVVAGTLDLKVGYEWFHLKEGDIMLINSDEIHCLKETEEENIVISVYVDCNAIYEKYPDFYEIIAIWEYPEAFEKLNQHKPTIMENVSKLAVMIEKGYDQETVMEQVDAFLKSLIYCYRIDITDLNGAAFQVTDEKQDMVYRIIKYLYSNYDHKVSLQDISEQEYMSMFYLSHKFKDITGVSFRDWLNFVRVEKAEKLLLETSEPITEIAYQCGFSDVRYFNKHFVKWYKISPVKYRQLFKESYETNSDMGRFQENVSMEDIIDKIEAVVPEARKESFEEAELILDPSVDKAEKGFDHLWKEKLWCNGSGIADHRKMQQIKEVQNDIDFSAIIIDEMFSTEIWQAEDTSASEMYGIFNFLLDTFPKLNVIVKCDREEQYEIDMAEEFLKSFLKFCPKWKTMQMRFKISMEDSDERTIERINDFIILLESINIGYEKIKREDNIPKELRDVAGDYVMRMIDGEVRLDWLYSQSGFKNNLYYLYFFLSKMGEKIVVTDDNYMITRRGDDYQILFHNDGAKMKYPEKIQYKIRLKNFSGDYKLVHYMWKSEQDDTSSIIKAPKVIKHLSDGEYEMINKASIPMISVDYVEKRTIGTGDFELKLSMTSTSMELVLLTSI